MARHSLTWQAKTVSETHWSVHAKYDPRHKAPQMLHVYVRSVISDAWHRTNRCFGIMSTASDTFCIRHTTDNCNETQVQTANGKHVITGNKQ